MEKHMGDRDNERKEKPKDEKGSELSESYGKGEKEQPIEMN